jgi:hypothetical protein
MDQPARPGPLTRLPSSYAYEDVLVARHRHAAAAARHPKPYGLTTADRADLRHHRLVLANVEAVLTQAGGEPGEGRDRQAAIEVAELRLAQDTRRGACSCCRRSLVVADVATSEHQAVG